MSTPDFLRPFCQHYDRRQRAQPLMKRCQAASGATGKSTPTSGKRVNLPSR